MQREERKRRERELGLRRRGIKKGYRASVFQRSGIIFHSSGNLAGYFNPPRDRFPREWRVARSFESITWTCNSLWKKIFFFFFRIREYKSIATASISIICCNARGLLCALDKSFLLSFQRDTLIYRIAVTLCTCLFFFSCMALLYIESFRWTMLWWSVY